MTVNVEWRAHARPPAGLTAYAMKARLDALPEPSPQASLEASKDPDDALFSATWERNDRDWANEARLHYHRHLIAAVCETVVVGSSEIQVRSYEFVRDEDGEGKWDSIENIVADPDLLDAYVREVQRYLNQAGAKMERVRLLLKERKAG